jgi:hypothetical protein
MPKRVLDGEGVWRSNKISRLPDWVKPEFANLIPLAFANGVFECCTRLVWSQVYAFNRPEISVDKVEEILDHLERAKLLFRWVDETGRTWGFWIGIDKPGRLPSESRKNKKHERIGPTPPEDKLAHFLTAADSKLTERGRPMASHGSAIGEVGFGSGIGSGSGTGIGKNPLSEVSPSDEEVKVVSSTDNLKNGTEAGTGLANLLKSQILTNKADYRIKPAQLRDWAHTADLMIRRDGRSAEQIRDLILWATTDDFWKGNILSMSKLREKFDQLEIRRDASPGRSNKIPHRSVPDNGDYRAGLPRHLAASDSDEVTA